MNQDSLFKKIEKLINPIRIDVGTLKSDVGTLKSDVGTLKSDIRIVKKVQNRQARDIESIKETQNSHTEILNSHTETLETHTSSLLNIETTNEVYGDMYKINDDNIRKMEKRVENLEEDAGIEAPEELTLTKVQ